MKTKVNCTAGTVLNVNSSLEGRDTRGVIHLVRTHKGGRGVNQMRTNAYKGEGGLTHEVRTQNKNLLAFCIHPATIN